VTERKLRSPAVSIVITTHNRSEMAQRAIESALNQSIRDVEVLVVDDGSERPFEPQTSDKRVSVIRLTESRGVCGARNAGLAAARGEWVMFLDDDDEIIPEMLEISLRAATGSTLPRPVAVLSGLEIVRPDGSLEATNLPVTLPKGGHYLLEPKPKGQHFNVYNTLLVPRDVLESLGGFDELLRSWVHAELFLRLNPTCSLQGVPLVTYRINRHHGEHVHSDSLGAAQSLERTITKHRAVFEDHPSGYSRLLCLMAGAYLRAGRWWPAVRASTRALLITPLKWRVVRTWVVSLLGPRAIRRATDRDEAPRGVWRAARKRSITDAQGPEA
jgi:glycosyltransferase involved in cell wall biosynthesis